MEYLGVFILVALTLAPNAFGAGRPLPLPGMPPSVPEEPKEHRHRVEGTDRTITWRRWQEMPGGDFRIRTGDRYLGHGKWQHYLIFELSRVSVKAIKLSMIHLGSEDVREDFLIRPGSRYAIAKVTNDRMTAHKGVWSWTAQEVH
jgi:hypothetical protein